MIGLWRKAGCAALGITWLLLNGAAHGELVMRSGIVQSRLIELYTSEGCSSCPPADRWFSTLRDHPGLWQDIVPVAFHVDYWDYIGWQDSFARPEFSGRQRKYARELNSQVVYTPGLIANGIEWRNFSWAAPEPAEPFDVGVLTVSEEAGNLAISFEPVAGAQSESLGFSMALLGFGLTSDVRRGENAGRELSHDFVALEMAHTPLRLDDGVYRGVIQQPESAVRAARYALAGWVSGKNALAPVQATGVWLDQTSQSGARGGRPD